VTLEKPRYIVEAFVVATAAPAILFGLLAAHWFMFLAVLAVAAFHTVLLGIPFFLLLRAHGWANAVTSIAGGFISGVIPTAVWSWTLTPVQALDFQGALVMGACGAFAGLWFWLYLRCRQALAATPTGQETPVPPNPQ
jgi:hypothetical protein